MKERRSQAAVSEIAELAGANPRLRWHQRLLRLVFRNWKSRNRGLVMFAGENVPRDLDDPLSDPKVQARVGEIIAKRGKRKGR